MPGQQISFSGSKYLSLKIGNDTHEAIFYQPRGNGVIMVPAIKENEKGPKIFRQENIQLALKAVSDEYLLTYRNLAFNPYDWQSDNVSFFPHIESNSEYKDEYRYSARNVYF